MTVVEKVTLQSYDVHASQMVPITNPPEGPRWMDYYDSGIATCSLLGGEADEMSVVSFSHISNFYAATHFHDKDQIQVIIEGEHKRGNMKLRVGQGVFTPAGYPYNMQCGANGIRWIEFRTCTGFGSAFVGRDRELIGDDAPAEIAGWPRPKPLPGSVVYFDLSTAPVQALATTGLGGDDLGPITGKVTVQDLVSPPSSDNHRLMSVTLAPNLDVPAHRQDRPRIIHVWAGQIEFDDGTTYRPGQGFLWPADHRMGFKVGPAGSTYLEFHGSPTWVTTW